MVVGNHESIVDGEEKKIVRFDSISSYAQSKFENISNDMVVTASNGDIILGAPAGTTLISGGNVLLEAANTLVLSAGQIIRDDDSAADVVKGSYKLDAQGEYSLNAGKLTLGSMGAMKITSFGSISQTIGGTSEETLANAPVMAPTAKTIKALLGKIVLESIEPSSGGVDLNVGPFGVAGKVSIGNLGIIDIASKLGITISAIKETTLEGIVKAIVKGTLIDIIAQGIVKIEGAGIHLNGSTEPALLGNEFWKVFKDHQHSSSVGPTGGILPAYSMKKMKTMSQKVFLG